MKKLALFSAAFIAVAVACDENPASPPLGGYSITATAQQTIAGFPTADGWTVKYTKFIVSFTAAQVQTKSGLIATTGAAQLADLVTGPAIVIADRNRVARIWDEVTFEIAPATADTATASSFGDAGIPGIVGASVYVEGTLTKDAVTKQFGFGLNPDTKYDACSEPQGMSSLPGIEVAANNTDKVDISITPEVLFSDAIGSVATTRANALANADANNDNKIDATELQKTTLDAARNETATYSSPTINTLGEFMNEQARSIVFSWRGNGKCVATPVTAAP
jgi:hypothetical protein